MHHLVGTGPMSERSIFVVDNEHANYCSCSSCTDILYTLEVHNVALYQLGGAQDDFA